MGTRNSKLSPRNQQDFYNSTPNMNSDYSQSDDYINSDGNEKVKYIFYDEIDVNKIKKFYNIAHNKKYTRNMHKSNDNINNNNDNNNNNNNYNKSILINNPNNSNISNNTNNSNNNNTNNINNNRQYNNNNNNNIITENMNKKDNNNNNNNNINNNNNNIIEKINIKDNKDNNINNNNIIADNVIVHKNVNDTDAINKCPFLQSMSTTTTTAQPTQSDIKKFLKLKNMSSTSEFYDVLFAKAKHDNNSTVCNKDVCKGSIMYDGNFPLNSCDTRNIDEIFSEAKEFLTQYFDSKQGLMSDEHTLRIVEVQNQLNECGYYHMKEDELAFGAKLAWRNASRCIGRIQWSKLQLFDYRHVKTTREMFDGICAHIKYATNEGNIRSGISVFPQRKKGEKDFRIWNSQYISFAGYLQEDGSIIGDPANVEFTELCLSLGWKPAKTQWDILPLVLSNGNEPDLYEYPADLILRVPLSHPKYEWFADLKLQWYAVPAVSGMLFDCGGIHYPATGFNGWYMSTEIGCRNLCDAYRFNITETVATKMNLDTSTLTSLWKDQVLVEVNIAVLHSFNSQNVTIVDHHTASETFMKHLENEAKLRKGCPSDWVWIVPPMSSSTTQVYHQEMALYHLKPSFEYQISAYKVWLMEKPRRKFHFKTIACSVLFSSILYKNSLHRRIKATILYATETGKSEYYAKQLSKLFTNNFNTQIMCMSDYNKSLLSNESLVIFVTSTFGNGDPPENGEEFKDYVSDLKYTDSEKYHNEKGLIGNNSTKLLHKSKFAVFALGSSAYPNYCSFGKYLNGIMEELGGTRIMDIVCGDELAGQEKAFRKWAPNVFMSACDAFKIKINDEEFKKQAIELEDKPLDIDDVRFIPLMSTKSLTNQLAKFHNKNIVTCTIKEKPIALHATTTDNKSIEEKSTILVKITTNNNVRYLPGDHVAIYPINRTEIVNGILDKLSDIKNFDEDIQLQILKKNGKIENWEHYERMPNTSIRTLLTRFFDITTPPSMEFLHFLSKYCKDEKEITKLEELSEDSEKYINWRNSYYPTLMDVLKQFPSCKPPATLFIMQLLPLQPRFYSISSSPQKHKNEIHLTVAVVQYKTKNNTQHYGVCSTYLQNLNANDNVYVFIRKANSFHLPEDTTKPIILIGPGTGIAPFRSFWQHIEIKSKDYWDTKVWLFCGSRTKEMDLYTSEKRQLLQRNMLDRVFNAYSREPHIPKTYVQDLIKFEADSIYKMIQLDGGHIYVCGDITMAEHVHQTIIEIISEKENKSKAEAEKAMYYLRKSNRYHEDIFGVAFRSIDESSNNKNMITQK